MRNQIRKFEVQKKSRNMANTVLGKSFGILAKVGGVVTTFQKGLDSPGCRAETQCATAVESNTEIQTGELCKSRPW